jgi:vancomycin permeability regulator SanA
MDFNIDMGIYGAIALVLGAVVVGVVLQLIGEVHFGFEWIVTGIFAFAAAVVASEFVTAWRTVEPVWDGVALLPALIAGVVVGIVADAVLRFFTHGSYIRHGPQPI